MECFLRLTLCYNLERRPLYLDVLHYKHVQSLSRYNDYHSITKLYEGTMIITV